MKVRYKLNTIFSSFVLSFVSFSVLAGECRVNPEWDNPPAAANPAIDPYFSDVAAAPNGTPITVFGADLSGPLIVGGVTLENCPFIDETVFSYAEAGVRLGKTTCWINDLPLGDTEISAGPQTSLSFKIIEGSVETVSDFDSFKLAMKDPEPGQIFLLRGFEADLTRDGKINGGKHILWMRNGEHEATSSNPIALIGYPGDPAKFVVDGIANGDRAISLDNNGWTISNLDFDTFWNSIAAEGEARIVGNRINGMHGEQRPAGTGTITGGGESKGGYIAGNIVTGGRTNWRFDHALYVTDCPSDQGWTVEWNYIYDNDFARGPQVAVNHQFPRCGSEEDNKSVASHVLRNNVVDTTSYRGRCIGVSALGWQSEFNPVRPGVVYISNNVLVNCGFIGTDVDTFNDARQGSAIYSAPGNTVIDGNVLIRPNGAIRVGTTGTLARVGDFLDTSISNNIFIDREGFDIELLLHELSLPQVIIQDNEDR